MDSLLEKSKKLIEIEDYNNAIENLNLFYTDNKDTTNYIELFIYLALYSIALLHFGKYEEAFRHAHMEKVVN